MNQVSLIPGSGVNGSKGIEPEARKRPRILLVEGDGFTRLVLLVHLRMAGFGVDFTSNGVLGLGKLRTCHPDILLMELRLCGMSGVELMRAARAEPTFGNRPICIFTHAERMTRSTRKEVRLLDARVFDKASVTREALVQAFAAQFLAPQVPRDKPEAGARAELAAEALNEMLFPGVIEEIIAGVRDQSEQLVKCSEAETRAVAVGELLSRVSSLVSCSEAVGRPNLSRHAKALADYLKQICSKKQDCVGASMSTIQPATEALKRMSLETTGKEPKQTRLNAVIVDEAPGSNRALKQALLRNGFEPVCFEDPPRARQYLASNRTDLIITNLVLPEAHSLALKDIRRLSLHAKTPAIFGAESMFTASLGDELPPRASRLDIEPLALAELVLQALNAVQGKIEPKSSTPSPARPIPGTRPARPVEPRAGTTSRVPSGSNPQLFSRTLHHEELPAVHEQAQDLSVPSEEILRPLGWSAGNLPRAGAEGADPGQCIPELAESEKSAECPSSSGDTHQAPFVQTESGASGADPEAESLARLPAETPIDGSQIDERPLEELLLSQLQTEGPQPSQPEPTVESQPVSTPNTASDSEPNTVMAVPAPYAATPDSKEVIKEPLQAASTEWLQPSPARDEVQSPREQATQPGELTAQAGASAMDFCQAETPFERKDKKMEAIHEQPAETAPIRTSGQTSMEDHQARERCVELEAEVASLRQALEDFNGSFGQEQQASAEANRQVHDLEEHLKQNAAELEKMKQDQQRASAEWRAQQEATDAANRQSEAVRRQAEDRCAQLEQDLDSLRQSRDELTRRLAEEQEATAKATEQLKKFEAPSLDNEGTISGEDGQERQIRLGVAALARATAELARERGERQRSDQRAAELNGRLQALHEDLTRTLQAQREDQARLSALEEQERQTRQTLEERTAELEQLQDERRLAEERAEKAKELNARLREDLSFFEGASKEYDGARQELQSRLEANLNAVRENEARLQRENAERQQLAETLEGTRRELHAQARRCETLEQQLQIIQDTLQDREAKLQKESAERQRLQEVLDSFQHNLQGESERDLEISKLQSALHLEQVERRRQETEAAQLRHSALDAARAARALRTGLRRQIREPVEHLVYSTRSLLELETGQEQRKLAEAVLQDVLLVQARLREPEPIQDEPAEVTGPQPPDSDDPGSPA